MKAAHRYLHDRASLVTSTCAPKTEPEPDAIRSETQGATSGISHSRVTIEHAEAIVSGNTAELKLTETTEPFLAAALADTTGEIPTETCYQSSPTMRFERVGPTRKLGSDLLDLPKYAPSRTQGVDKSGPDAPVEEPAPSTAVATNRTAAVEYGLKSAQEPQPTSCGVFGRSLRTVRPVLRRTRVQGRRRVRRLEHERGRQIDILVTASPVT